MQTAWVAIGSKTDVLDKFSIDIVGAGDVDGAIRESERLDSVDPEVCERDAEVFCASTLGQLTSEAVEVAVQPCDRVTKECQVIATPQRCVGSQQCVQRGAVGIRVEPGLHADAAWIARGVVATVLAGGWWRPCATNNTVSAHKYCQGS
eukprot:COSAG02_NODE_2166_length_9611_cov_5.049201_1_plen_149_part_00